ncbi:DUF1906 domain-containing protein [Corynebacterium amycolatum]|uniref:glycoside hydrolase domain-containing protein n=1 Tax=Corynebacterium amycolatum TaxID=43765 RepID=UPI00211A54C3|nr:glycoside hydrolase domain-containing protein [Corynebacterium amycolatum]MCQ9168566.1 DUF1906 domain-containing protein [Corynebacterium amycolatum]MCQ9176102.1 DUF1906 domain-containing protein [Corynebacterium amycolatum]
MATVLDYSAKPIPARLIRDAGHLGAVRYISPPREKWMQGKPATADEVADFKANALDTAFVWQYGGVANPDAMRGAEGGKADAEAADKQLKAIKRTGYPVFFAVDFDITLDQWNNTAVHYFKACCEVLGRHRVGIYGHSRVCDWAREDGVIGTAGDGKYLMWQTISWSHGAVHPQAVLLQNVHNVPGPAGVQVDVNQVLHTYWGQHPPGNTPAPKPKENTVADNAVDIDLHHLIPFGNPTKLPKKRIIVHTTENAPGTSSRAILDYQVRTRTGSYHRLVDATGQITLANTDDWQVWAVGNKGNDIALHVSLVAQAKMTREQWLAQPKMLEGCARVIAYWARTYDIPLVKLSREELGAGKHGVAGHLEAQVWGNTDHWDPGYHFPYDVVLARAKEINAGAKPAEESKAIPPAPEKRAPITLDTPCKSHVPGSKHVAPLADFIMYIDRGVFESRRMIDSNAKRLEALEKKQDEILALLKEGKK